jgi:hypothetical protein
MICIGSAAAHRAFLGEIVSCTSARVPLITPEIAVVTAFFGWSIRQIANYVALTSLPIGEHFLEEPWPDFRSKAGLIREARP